MSRKYVCVIGLGNFGAELARELSSACEVLAVDRDEARVDAVVDTVQRALILDAADGEALGSAVSDDFDEAVVSMGDNLEASVLCVLHLGRIGVRSIRAKALSDDHASILRAVGATEVIFPERETARRVAARVQNPNLLDFIPLEGDYRVMEVAPPESFHGKSLLDLKLRSRYGCFVVAVKETAPEGFRFLPEPDHVIKRTDILVVIGTEKSIMTLRDDTAPDDATAQE